MLSEYFTNAWHCCFECRFRGHCESRRNHWDRIVWQLRFCPEDSYSYRCCCCCVNGEQRYGQRSSAPRRRSTAPDRRAGSRSNNPRPGAIPDLGRPCCRADQVRSPEDQHADRGAHRDRTALETVDGNESVRISSIVDVCLIVADTSVDRVAEALRVCQDASRRLWYERVQPSPLQQRLLFNLIMGLSKRDRPGLHAVFLPHQAGLRSRRW